MSDITIRNATLADAPRILEIYAYYVEHTVITFEYDVPSLAEFEGRMRDIMKKYPYLVIERDGRIEGYAYAHAFVGRAAYDWAAELTIYLDHDARRGGMGRVLYEALADRLKAMGVLNLYACIGYRLIVTVDCGITALDEALLCREKNIDLVITDHHECKTELPQCAAVVDPHRPDQPDIVPYQY